MSVGGVCFNYENVDNENLKLFKFPRTLIDGISNKSV